MRFVVVLMILAAAGCGEIEPDPVLDEEGEEIPVPGPFDTYLDVESVNPPAGLIAPDSPIEIRFSTWLEDDVLLNAGMMSMASGGIRTGGYVRWVMTTRSLVWTPYGTTEPGLRYSLSIDTARLRSVTGAPPALSTLPTYKVSSVGERLPTIDLSPVRWPEVDALFQARCSSCHSDPNWQLNPLRRDTLVGVESEQVDRFLVRPGDAADSYLLEKLLPAYPRRELTIQPPPWSGLDPLSEDEILLVERWIIAGAPP